MTGRYSEAPQTDLVRREKELYGRKVTRFDLVIRYIFFFVLGAVAACIYGKATGIL